MPAIAVEGLTKRFGDVYALDDLSLSVREGEIYGFLGPNGAGKSTTINVLLDFVRPTEGEARVLGMDARDEGSEIRSRVGVLPDGYEVYERLTARQHLEFVADSKGVPVAVDTLLERVGLDGVGDRRAGGFSKGMAQRLVLAMSLVGDPDLLILDEPTTGLDPNGARRMRGIIREENARGTTVFFSSHILDQVEAVCDRVGILQDGRLVAEDTIEGLREGTNAGSTLTVDVADPPGTLERTVSGVEGVQSVRIDGSTVEVNCQNAAKLPVLNAIDRAGGTVENFETRSASLEDLFADVTGADERPVGRGSRGRSDGESRRGSGPGGGERA